MEDVLERMLGDFHAEHERAYGFAAPGEPVEFVTLWFTAVGNIAKPRLRELPRCGGDVTATRGARCAKSTSPSPVASWIVHEAFSDAVVSLSSEVAPEFRECPRASITLINACMRPIVEQYLSNIKARMRDAGLQGQLLVMQSSGGVLTFEAARTKPVFIVESGPAAGVIVSAYLGETLGFDKILSFDMGGAIANTGLIERGHPSRVALGR